MRKNIHFLDVFIEEVNVKQYPSSAVPSPSTFKIHLLPWEQSPFRMLSSRLRSYPLIVILPFVFEQVVCNVVGYTNMKYEQNESRI